MIGILPIAWRRAAWNELEQALQNPADMTATSSANDAPIPLPAAEFRRKFPPKPRPLTGKSAIGHSVPPVSSETSRERLSKDWRPTPDTGAKLLPKF